MNIALWIVQGLLAVAFGMAGMLKLTKSRAELEPNMGYVEDLTDQQLTTIGVLEVLGAVGVVLPWATGILPWLTPLAAVGLVIIMVGAALLHLRRKEPAFIIPNIVLGALATFVAIGRF